MPGSESRPEFLIDRSLGRKVLARELAGAGAAARTLHDVYGSREERVADDEWLSRAGVEGWIVLTRDGRIRYRTAELEAIRASRAKIFVVIGKGLTGPEIADRVVRNLHRIEQAARHRGPFVCAIYERKIARLWPEHRR